jgi:hypothetical protein
MKKRDKIFREVNYRKFLGREGETDTTKPPIATVKKVVECWQKGGLDAVKIFLNESIVWGNTWEDKIKKLINEGKTLSAQAEIELVAFNLDFRNQLYKKKLDPNKIEKHGR